jgi:uncharacterized protein (TIGR02246 family)
VHAPDLGLVAAWASAWNRHDAEAAAGLVMPEIDFVNVLGHWFKGKGEFLEHHRQLHSGQMRNSLWRNLSYEARFITEDLAIVHWEWTIEGDENPDRTPRRPRKGIFTWIVLRLGKNWRIAAAQNTNMHSAANHRLLPATEEPSKS